MVCWQALPWIKWNNPVATVSHIFGNIILCLVVIAAVLLGILFLVPSQWPDTANASFLREGSISGPAPSPPLQEPSPARAIDVPILVYHNIHPPYVGESDAVRKVTISPDVFEKEMNYLNMSGYHVISFSALEQYLDNGTQLPPRPIIISLDDCWEDQFTYAFPILRKYHFSAAFFVITNYVGHRDFLSWAQVRQLSSTGMTIGSHSRTHPFLDRVLDRTRLIAEIEGSKRTIEEEIKTPVNEFAYPYGAFDQSVVALVKSAGYRSARADYPGIWHSKNDEYFLSAINAPPEIEAFEKRLSNSSEAEEFH